MSWRSFFDGDHAIYVNDRHRRVHAARLAEDMVSVVPGPGAVVLDHGCGEALDADRVAAACGRLYLFDIAPSIQARLRQRFADDATVRVLDEAGLHALADSSLDLIVTSSVLQYVDAAGTEALLALWQRKLAPGGLLVLADVLPEGSTLVPDTLSLLRTGWRHGFLLAALKGLVSLLLSDYAKLRRELGLTRWREADLLALMARHGMTGRRRPANFGFNPVRMTFEARKEATASLAA